jgi:DNA-binding SARP family transcriptional activator
MGVLYIALFGSHVSVVREGETPVKLTRAMQNLLAYLLLQRQRLHSREVLLDLFWKELNQKQARGCLNTALWRLRKVLEPPEIPFGTYLVTTSSGEVGFNHESEYWLDVAIFESQVERITALPVEAILPGEAEDLSQALGLYKGELLEGVYDDWAIQEREYLRRLYLNGLSHLMAYYFNQKAYSRAQQYGQAILRIDPLREEIHRRLMRLYIEAGDRAQAAVQYETCRKILEVELGIEPMEETQALYSGLLASSRDRPDPEPTSGSTGLQDAVNQLQQATHRFEDAQQQLQHAIHLLERLASGDN